MAIMSKLTASYVAGYIDGEGYFGIIPNFKKSSYREVLKITSVDGDIINWLQKSFGGSVHKRIFKTNSKDAYCWTLEGKNLVPFIEKVIPYLKLKRKQAELILEKRKLRKFYEDKGERKGIIYPNWVKEKVQYLYQEIRRLNFRGKSLHLERLSEETTKSGCDSPNFTGKETVR